MRRKASCINRQYCGSPYSRKLVCNPCKYPGSFAHPCLTSLCAPLYGFLQSCPSLRIPHRGASAGNILESNSPNWRAMTLTESDEARPWWEDNTKLVSVIIGLPVVGLIIIGVLTLIGINTPDFPYMISADFFVADLFLRLLTLPIGFIAIRAFLRSMDNE